MLNNVCDVCKESKTVHTNRKTGKKICISCYRKDPSNHEKCSVCGNMGRVAIRHINGDVICDTCRSKARRKDRSKHEKCSICERVKFVAKRNEAGEAICEVCNKVLIGKDTTKHGICFVCKKEKNVEKNKNGLAVCKSCKNKAYYHNPSKHKKCSKCGEVKPVAKRDKNNEPICPMCWRRSKVGRCTSCRKKNVIKAKGLCHTCFK